MNCIFVTNSISLWSMLVQLWCVLVHLVFFLFYILFASIFWCKHTLCNYRLTSILTLVMNTCVTCFLLLFDWTLNFVSHQILWSYSDSLRISYDAEISRLGRQRLLLYIIFYVTFTIHFHHGISRKLVFVQERHFWGLLGLFV